jgi:hypothetical protein
MVVYLAVHAVDWRPEFGEPSVAFIDEDVEEEDSPEYKLALIKAYNAGLREYAWWKDGEQYVGTCGTKLKDALKKEELINP